MNTPLLSSVRSKTPPIRLCTSNMPYINQIKFTGVPSNAGELNYVFTRIAENYLKCGDSYQKFNDIIGALEGCKLELYRRVVSPYEDTKIKENGDVYRDRNAVVRSEGKERATAS